MLQLQQPRSTWGNTLPDCIDHNPPQNYQQVKERYPQLPVQRLGEARRFA